jgi:hypothetical protein
VTATGALQRNNRFDRAALARLSNAGYCAHDTAVPHGSTGQVRCDSGCDVVYASREAWASADPLPYRPSLAWLEAHPAVVAARAAKAAYLRQHPQHAELWRVWEDATDAMVDPGRADAEDWEQITFDAYRKLPDWFGNMMGTLLGHVCDALAAAEAGWRAGERPPATG